jgi:hypothetical protein
MTEVALHQISGAGPAEATARIPGGPVPDGRDVPGAVDLDRDETVGLILSPTNEPGVYTFGPLQLFRQKGARSYGNLHDVFSGAISEFAAEAQKRIGAPCPEALARNTVVLPPSPIGMPAVVTDVVDTEVFGTTE